MGVLANTLDSLQETVYHGDTDFLKLRPFVSPWFN